MGINWGDTIIPKWKLREMELKTHCPETDFDPLSEEQLRCDALKYHAYSEKYGVENYPSYPVLKTLLDLVEIPGKGHSRDTCGKPILRRCSAKGCTKPNYIVKSSCNQRGCPEDYKRWAIIQGREGASKIWLGARLIKQKLKARWFRIHHTEVMVKVQDGDTIASLKELAKNISKEHGFIAGNSCFHPYKKDDKTNDYTIQDGTYHLHNIAITITKWKQSEKGQTYKGREYLFKVNPDPCDISSHRKRFFKTRQRCDCKLHYRGIKHFQDLNNIIKYEVGHAGYIGRGHAVSYWGELGNNKLPKDEIRKSNPIAWDFYHKKLGSRCPNCGSYDTHIDWDAMKGCKPPPPREVEYLGTVIVKNDFVTITDCNKIKVGE